MRRLAAAVIVVMSVAVCALAQDDAPQLEYKSLLMFNQHLYFGTFSRPRAIAFDRERHEVWVADSGNGMIGVFGPDGSELYAFASKRYLRDPVRIAVTPQGMLAVVEGDHAHIRLFSYRGVYKSDVPLAGIGEKPIIGAIAYDAAGDLYVGENRSAQLFVYRPDGKLKQQFGSRGTDEGQFRSITAITIGPDGSIYVADAQALAVQVFDDQGNFVRGWGRHEMGGEHFSLPSGIALDSQGRVLVTDELRHQVKVFSAEGKLLTQFGGLGTYPGELSFPTDIAVDDHDRVYVAERSTARVQVFEPAAHERR